MYTRNLLGELSIRLPFRIRCLTDEEKAECPTTTDDPKENLPPSLAVTGLNEAQLALSLWAALALALAGAFFLIFNVRLSVRE